MYNSNKTHGETTHMDRRNIGALCLEYMVYHMSISLLTTLKQTLLAESLGSSQIVKRS